MKLLLLLLFTTLLCFSARAQSHTFKQCYLNKEWAAARKDAENNASNCPACIEKRKKEKVARQQEMKRREEVVAAQKKAEREAAQKEFAAAQKQKQEEAKKAKSGEVLINAQPREKSNAVIASKPVKGVKGLLRSDLAPWMYTLPCLREEANCHRDIERFNYFISGTDTILKGRFIACIGLRLDQDNEYRFPENIGIVALKEYSTYPRSNFYPTHVVCDLVNSSGERLLNDNDITYILHFYDHWFVLLKGGFSISRRGYSFDDGEIYNIKTKEKYPLKKNTEDNRYIADADYIVSRITSSTDNSSESNASKALFRTWLSDRNQITYYLTNEGKVAYEIEKK